MMCSLCCDIDDDVKRCQRMVKKNYKNTPSKRKAVYFYKEENKYYCELHYKDLLEDLAIGKL